MKSLAPASKPISSPGRPDKYPAPLMRFLRGSTASKSSRARSRSTPLFTRRKRSTAIEEPSSPKVTCIGQVRVRRSSSKSKHRANPPPPLKRRPSTNAGSGAGASNWFCFWVGKPPAICCSFRFRKRKQSCFRPIWRKWVGFFCCWSNRDRTHSSKKGSHQAESAQIFTDSDSDSYDIRQHRFQNRAEEEEATPKESSGRVIGSIGSGESTTSPPKNALLLTRCRSAPHRSSYLASQIWQSPEKTEEEENKAETEEQESRVIASEIAAAELGIVREGEGNLGICEVEAAETESVGCLKKAETSTATEKANGGDEEEEQKIVVALTRCKSEPARRSGDPLSSSFWKERRLESTVSCRNSVEAK